MLSEDNIIKDGDSLILFEDMKPKSILTLQLGQTFQNKTGAYHHASIVGKKIGEKIWSKSRQGFIYLLKPNSFLITETVPHKTQILFQMDISMIIMMLDVRPGKRVVESGTGSGSLTCSLTQAMRPSGSLFSYEFNQDRAENGQQLINKLNYQDITTIFWRDVYGNGFIKVQEDNTFNDGKEFPEEGSIDAIFLDLPQPWLALEHSKKVIKSGGRLCSFSPCIEQVQKSCLKLKEDGWKGLQTIECLKRQFERRVKTELVLFDKRKKLQMTTDSQDEVHKQIKIDEQGIQQEQDQSSLKQQSSSQQQQKEQTPSEKKVFYSAGVAKAYGHTGYLTFGFLP